MADTSKFSEFTFDCLEQIDEEFGDGYIRGAAIVFEVDEQDDSGIPEFRVFAMDDRRYQRRIILEMGIGQLEVEAEEIVREDDEE